MPCRDYSENISQVVHVIDPKLKKRLDKVTELLCSLCRVIEEDQKKNLPPKARSKQSLISKVEGLEDWWIKHKALDKKRENDELRERARKAMIANALSKLTVDELKILGLNNKRD